MSAQPYTLEKEGRDFAVQMMRKIEEHQEECDRLDPEYNNEGLPQNNVMDRFLDDERLLRPEFRRGFSAVITDYIAVTIGGCVPDLELYERLNRKAGGGS